MSEKHLEGLRDVEGYFCDLREVAHHMAIAQCAARDAVQLVPHQEPFHQSLDPAVIERSSKIDFLRTDWTEFYATGADYELVLYPEEENAFGMLRDVADFASSQISDYGKCGKYLPVTHGSLILDTTVPVILRNIIKKNAPNGNPSDVVRQAADDVLDAMVSTCVYRAVNHRLRGTEHLSPALSPEQSEQYQLSIEEIIDQTKILLGSVKEPKPLFV